MNVIDRTQFELRRGMNRNQCYISRDSGIHYFLVAKATDTPVSYAKVYPDYFGRPVSLADIETREEYRNYGYASLILEMIAEEYGVDKVHHDGAFTEDGYFYISKHLDRSNADPATISCSDMTFVYDWDNMISKFE